MITHTPGPWTAEPIPSDAHTDPDLELSNDYVFWIAESHERGEVLAAVEKNSRGNAEANARLMGAAPELLDALKGMVASYDGLRDGLTCKTVIGKLAKADAAIARAEGAK